MGNYVWRSGDREGSGNRKPNYAVKWEFSNPDQHENYRQMTDLVNATNAERAINKVRKMLEQSRDFGQPISRRDVTIISAVPIEGMYCDA